MLLIQRLYLTVLCQAHLTAAGIRSPKMALFVTVALVCVGSAMQGSLAFKAAVYEHVQRGDPWSESQDVIAAKNLRTYAEAARNASIQGADIIVFPEKGITFAAFGRSEIGLCADDVPEPGQVTPCDQTRLGSEDQTSLETPCSVLSTLSCIARENDIYLVANMVDKKPCLPSDPSCPPDGRLFYNTNVAFDRNGTLISRYHKNNLYGEREFAKPDPPDFGVFETDFGRRIGMFICFDVLFREASELVSRFQIDVAVTSTGWVDELPGWFSVGVQQAWSMRHDIPLLASETHRAQGASVGSGIFLGKRGPLIYTYSPDGKDKLLVADLDGAPPADPRYPGDQTVAARRIYFEADPTKYVTMELQGASGVAAACQRGFCCMVRYSAPVMNERFFLLVRNGKRNIMSFVSLGIQECMVSRCEPKGAHACRSFPYTSSTTFTQLDLSADFASPDIFPLLVSDQLALTPVRYWNTNVTSENRATLRLDAARPPPEPLLSALLVARLFNKDSPVARF